MSHLVQQHRDEVDACAVVIVQTVVPESAGEARRLAQIAVEVGADVSVGSILWRAGKLVGQRLGIPGACLYRAGEVTEYAGRTCRAQSCGGRRAGKRGKLRIDDDRHGAGQRRAPDIGRESKRIEPLGADRRACVAADRRRRCGIVEAYPGGVYVVDDDRRGGCRRARRQCHADGEGRAHELQGNGLPCGISGHCGSPCDSARRSPAP